MIKTSMSHFVFEPNFIKIELKFASLYHNRTSIRSMKINGQTILNDSFSIMTVVYVIASGLLWLLPHSHRARL